MDPEMTAPAQSQSPAQAPLSRERTDLLETLTSHRFFLRHTVQGITDEQARQRTTVSELCLGGLIKHVARTEQQWVDFILHGPSAFGADRKDSSEWGEADFARFAETFRMQPGETLARLLADYDKIAARTDDLVRTVDLDADHPLPEAPWFEPGARRSARRVLMHIVAETAQHAGHADIIREALDGQKTMG
jgi:hypothetical protein